MTKMNHFPYAVFLSHSTKDKAVVRPLAQDTIGIVPAYASLHRANQRAWAAEDVFDVLYYADLGRFKRRLAPFVRWEPLPIVRPRE